MEWLTIGAFAKACRLSPKALRLYDELELLRPARVDPDTGYRYYTGRPGRGGPGTHVPYRSSSGSQSSSRTFATVRT
ncbi:HTH merR-type domain-containing protein OS=Streptomyces aurantiogriseus OX=66870 GN=GCM10010251_39740 PE=4 SV=1 [Streptomyces aurantiogriseus]|uniref:HTH merR-type domain-containing protein n=1 Tax=Streptomyces aurantiogriseus TaxID=66870 RepID=A0A918CE35_9ACTN|nr:hypothetical protein GCM10010251_39740 [Streptomyces aurantiogriseus]